MKAPSRVRHILAGSAGNLVEWYDWYAYSAFALYFAPRFFPKGDTTAQLMDGAAVFAVGFLMRPIGAWLMGLYADRRGRKAGLTLSVAMMCAGSLAIALTPDASRIGLAAPAILILARLAARVVARRRIRRQRHVPPRWRIRRAVASGRASST